MLFLLRYLLQPGGFCRTGFFGSLWGNRRVERAGSSSNPGTGLENTVRRGTGKSSEPLFLGKMPHRTCERVHYEASKLLLRGKAARLRIKGVYTTTNGKVEWKSRPKSSKTQVPSRNGNRIGPNYSRVDMGVLEMVGLTPLIQRTSGRPEVIVGLIDGPVALDHPDLAGQRIREIPRTLPSACINRNSIACAHGTFVAGMLAAKRSSVVPGICPDCSFLLRPIFSDGASRGGVVPTATSEELAAGIVDCVQAGARVLNLSVNLTGSSNGGQKDLAEALSFAATRGVIPVVAAPNQGVGGSSTLTCHDWVLPVMACDHAGQPLDGSNLPLSVGRRGLRAPGKEITSLGANGKPLTITGTSAAAAFVTGAIALLWSELPAVKAGEMRFALTNRLRRRPALVPPLLNAWSIYQSLTSNGRNP